MPNIVKKQVLTGIYLVRIPLPFRLDHVNCYLLEGNGGWTVIDTGLHNQSTVNIWEKMLEGRLVQNIVITHYHPDHYGYAGGLQEKTRAPVWMSQTDAENGLRSWETAHIDRIRRHYPACGLPEQLANQMVANTESFLSLITPHPKIEHYLQDGETVNLGWERYTVITTPGHSDGMLCFYNKLNKVLFSADHILPKITPNISYWFHGDPNPLQSYLDALHKVKELDIEIVLPSHGEPFYNAHERIDEIVHHHHERLDKVLDVTRSERTVYEVCLQLFGDRLNVHEMRFAIGETIAHLEYLVQQGEMKKEEIRGKWLYANL